MDTLLFLVLYTAFGVVVYAIFERIFAGFGGKALFWILLMSPIGLSGAIFIVSHPGVSLTAARVSLAVLTALVSIDMCAVFTLNKLLKKQKTV